MRPYSPMKKMLPVLVGLVIIIGIIWGVMSLFSPSYAAKRVVREFYDYEQEGNFSESWELFHSKMQEKFAKSHYIQDRAHVFLNHFGVNTFEYDLGDVETVKGWKMGDDAAPFEKAYQVSVTQTFKGKYGNFDINQDVYVVKEKDEWKILWDYKK